MIGEDALLPALLALVDVLPLPAPPCPAPGRPKVYSDRLMLKALVIMVLKRLPHVSSLLAVLAQPTPEMVRLRACLTEGGRFPSRRTWDRRLDDLSPTLPALIACLGAHLLRLLDPWHGSSMAVAIDSTVLAAHGGVWHRKHREAGIVPHSSIDTEAGWTKSGWHGWVYGWKLHLVTTVAGVWLPVAADLTPANTADNVQAPLLLAGLPPPIRFILGDMAYDDGDLRQSLEAGDRVLVTTKRGPYPHVDEGVEVRRIFHQLRSKSIENFNEQFKAIFAVHGQVPTRGRWRTRRFVLGAVMVYQLALWYRHETGGDLRIGLKPLLQAA